MTNSSVSQSVENGEKAEKEAEPESEEKPEEPEEIKEKAKAKKGKKEEEGGFELWNELEIQRIKFMVIVLYIVSDHSQLCRNYIILYFSFITFDSTYILNYFLFF